MSRRDFLNILAQSITHLSKEEQDEILYDYEEHFRIGLEQGKTEDEIAESLGNPYIIANQFGPSPAPVEKTAKSITGKVILTTAAIMCVVSVFFALYRNNLKNARDQFSDSQKVTTTMNSEVQKNKETVDTAPDKNQVQSQVSNSDPNAKIQHTIDGEKTLALDNITMLNVTFVSGINFINVDTKEIKIHLYGDVTTNNNFVPELQVSKSGSQATISVTSASSGTSYYSSTLRMDVYIPKTYSQSITTHITSGSIKLSNLKLETLNCKSVSGSVDIRDIVSRQITAETTSGDIRLDSISGDLKVQSTSGSITVSYKDFNNNITAENVSGSTDLKLSENAEFALQAKTISGEITNSFPMTSSSTGKGKSLTGTVKSDRNRITINSVSGGIHIYK